MAKLDFSIIVKAVLILFAIMIPLSYVHEAGHATICEMEGHSFDISVDLTGGSMVCHGDVDNYLVYRAAGGLSAMVASFVPLLAYSWMKRHPYFLIAFLAMGIGHGLNAGIETFLFDSYITDHKIWSGLMGLFAFLIYLGLAPKYAKKEEVQNAL